MFTAPLSMKRDERGSTFVEELCTDDPVNRSRREGENYERNKRRHNPLNERNSSIAREISRVDNGYYRPHRLTTRDFFSSYKSQFVKL